MWQKHSKLGYLKIKVTLDNGYLSQKQLSQICSCIKLSYQLFWMRLHTNKLSSNIWPVKNIKWILREQVNLEWASESWVSKWILNESISFLPEYSLKNNHPRRQAHGAMIYYKNDMNPSIHIIVENKILYYKLYSNLLDALNDL